MKFCPYCGRQANDDDNFCQGCGARLDTNNTTNETEAVVIEQAPAEDKPKGAPHWLIKMLSLISLLTGVLFFTGQCVIAVGTGIACLCLDKKGEFKGRAIAGIVLGSIFTLFYIVYYVTYIVGVI